MERMKVIWRALTGRPEPSIEKLRAVAALHAHRLDAVEQRTDNLETAFERIGNNIDAR